ncbi:MAG TPA: glycoside hydrolase family 47 protein [Pseudonocardiaceae bacterium]|jgi:mannosyl-oligosaccharide alpha-1,2-mannosidase|nr:glycoside hydrolase family 47 protein [Pseudonocardiaceae bacterium]
MDLGGGLRRPISRRSALTALAVTGGLGLTGGLGGLANAATAPLGTAGTASNGISNWAGATAPPAQQAAAQIRTEFLHAWDGYKKFAWGHDQVNPVSGTYDEFFVTGHPIGLSIIEALDTLYVMELDEELSAGISWIDANVNFDIDGDFHVFEAIIRVVGGLLAGYLAVKDAKLLALAKDLTDRLMPAFASSTGLPYQYVNLHTGAVSGNTPPLAEIGTNILEFGVLSQLTGDPKYFNAAKKAYQVTMAKISPIGLLGTYLDVETGEWTDSTDQAPNPPVDSFYEYLWGGWAMFHDTDCLRWFTQLNAALSEYSLETYNGNVWYKQVDFQTGALAGREQSELAAFWAEVLGHAGQLNLARGYYKSWTTVLDKYPVLPEGFDYATFTADSGSGNQFRPEYVNSSFDLYFQTRDPYFANTAWQYFLGMKNNARVTNGYTIINDVTTSPMQLGDLFPAYGFAENFKYLYLIFANSPRFDAHNFYLSTEGKVLRGLVPAK